MEGEAPPEIDHAVAEEINKSAKAVASEPRPKVVQENPNIKGVNVLLTDASGAPQIVKVGSGAEGKALREVQSYLKTGGKVEGIHFHPDSWSDAQKFMGTIANETEESFKGAKVIRTEENHAPAVAADLTLSNVKADPATSDSVVVESAQPKRPSYADLQAKSFELLDEENYPLSKGARQQVVQQIDKLWDPATPMKSKETIAQQLSNWDLKDVIPVEWIREPELGEDLTPEVTGREHEIEKNRLEEIVAKEPPKGRFEELGIGNKLQPIADIRIPDSESVHVRMGKNGLETILFDSFEIGQTQRRVALKTSNERLQDLSSPGVEAFVLDPGDTDKFVKDLPEFGGPKGVPAIVYSPGIDRMHVYHENLHVDKFHITDGTPIIQGYHDSITPENFGTMFEIGQELKGLGAYKDLPDGMLNEEAFVHAASAIRTGNNEYLSRIVALDTSTETVLKMVNNVADSLLTAARGSDWYAPARVVQRKMKDLLLRSSDARTFEMRDQIKNMLSDAWHDPETNVWKVMGTDGKIQMASAFEDLATIIHDSDGSSIAPSISTEAEMRGIRGPFTPRGGSAVKDPGPMDTPPDTRWKGWTAISGLFRPMQPWVADLDSRVNAALSKAGRNLPIFDRWKDLSEADRAYETEAHDLYDKAAGLLEGAGKKQYDYMEVLMTEPRYWKQMGEKLKLNDEDLNKVAGLNNWMQEFRDRTGINPFNYLRDELPRLRGHNYNTEMVYSGGTRKELRDMSTFERLMATGKLDPKNRHLGSFMDTLIREARMQKLEKPMRELRSLVDKKSRDGSYILGNMRYPLDNYLRYMSGIPDVTSQVMKQSVSDFQRFLGERAKQMNKTLPDWAQLPTEFQYPGAIINKLLVWSYAAGLGLRASIPVRDALQVFTTTMPVLGPSRFMRGLTYFAQNGFKLAEESGALLGRKNMGDLYGDIFSELPPGASTDRITKLAQKLLSPSRGGHNVGRAVGFYGEYLDALDGITDYKSGKITLDELIKDRTHLWFNDKAVANRMVDLIHTTAPQEAAKQIALEMTDITLWPYRRGMQPTLLRTGAGRIFGQFGMWPMNYLDFLRRGSTKFAEYPQQATKTLALWAATNYASVSAMNGIGADASKWFFVSPAGYGLSPHAQFVLDLGKAWEETPDGRAARKRVLEYPMDFFPAGIEARNIESVLQSGEEPFTDDGHPTPALLKVLGFKPMKETPDRDMEEQIKFELGLGKEKGVQ
jgi:hypothetical protein